MRRRRFLAVLTALPLLAGQGGAHAGNRLDRISAPGPRDLCPVCGMVVAKYPNWAATVVWQDGHVHHFDGAKDMFKFLFDLPRYAPGHRREEIAAIAVTDYYELKRIDGREAWYVIGSDVPGPMGHELVPLASRADAEEFMRDHRGRRILTFEDVKGDLPARLDQGKF